MLAFTPSTHRWGSVKGIPWPPALSAAPCGLFFHDSIISAMQQQDNRLAAEITSFMQQVFRGCNITQQYYPDHGAWKFEMSFQAGPTCSYHICPPKACCLTKVHAVGQNVTFNITLFVDQFISYHLQKIAN